MRLLSVEEISAMSPAALEAYQLEQRKRVGHLFDHVAQLVIADASMNTTGDQILQCGTASLVRTTERDLVVTCAHVYDFFQTKQREMDSVQMLMLGTGGAASVDVTGWPLVEKGSKLSVDLAVIAVPETYRSEVQNKRFFEVAFPQRRAELGDLVIAFGLPTQMQQLGRGSTINPKRFMVGGPVSSVTDRGLMVHDYEQNRFHFRGEGSNVATDKIDLGGMSGGAAFILDEELGSPSLAGFVYEATPGQYLHLALAHIDFITPDGTFDHAKFYW